CNSLSRRENSCSIFWLAVFAGAASRKIRSVLTKPILVSCAWALPKSMNDAASKTMHLDHTGNCLVDVKIILRDSVCYTRAVLCHRLRIQYPIETGKIAFCHLPWRSGACQS